MKIISVKYEQFLSKQKCLISENIISAIGNFDGIHIGHTKLINEVIKEAYRNNLASSVITFDPHPRDFFSKDKEIFKIIDREEKLRLIKDLGIKYFIEIKFDQNLRNLDSMKFINDILKNMLNVKQIFAGENFRFGRNRQGSFKVDEEIFKNLKIKSKSVDLLSNNNKETISSNLIRDLIRSGGFKIIKNYLNRNWAITGIVKKGNQNGTKINFPTANLELSHVINPQFGVYITKTRLMDTEGQNFISESMPSISNFGIRPTLGGEKPFFETHILNIKNFINNTNLYKKRIYVEIISFIRSEFKFRSLSDLKKQIEKDIEIALCEHKKN